jgi:hypothetical protein
LNWYSYVGNNPLVFVDPTGLWLDPCFGFWDGAQFVLDIAGMVPGLGEPLDLVNAGISLARGNYADAALSAGSAIPFAGWGASLAKVARKVEKHHVIPREILKRLDDNVYRAVRGKKGAPNRWAMPQDFHRELHKGARGGRYNQFFRDRLPDDLSTATVEDVMRVRDEAVEEFGLGAFRP